MKQTVNNLTLLIRATLLMSTATYCFSAHAAVANQKIVMVNNTQNESVAYPTYQAHSLSSRHTNSPSVTLDPIVVTATRSNKLLSDSPITVQLLDKKTLDDHHAHTLKDALALLPNVYLRQLHGKTGYEISMQGFSGDQVLVLIDGLPITASTGSTVNLNQYLNVDIQQIEIIQGAASAQFGSSAMGGVINVITTPITNTKAHLSAELGSNGSQNPSDRQFDSNSQFVEASLQGSLTDDQRLKARVSASYLDDAGLSIATDQWPRLKDASEQKVVNARLSFTPDADSSDSVYWLEASRYEEDDVSRFSYYVPPRSLNQQKDEAITKQRFSIGGQTTFDTNINPLSPTTHDANSRFKLSGSALYEDYDSHSITHSNGITTDARTTDITTNLAQLQLDLPQIEIGDSQAHVPQVGVQWQRDELSQFSNHHSELTSDQVSRDALEGYIQDDWFIGDNWEVIAGLRYQNDTDFGDHFAPKIAVKYDHYDDQGRKHVIRGSVGTGYRVPNLKERYYIFDHSNLGYKVLGNSDLSPETSTSYQLGYQSDITDTLTVALNGFYNDIADLIQTDMNNVQFENDVAIYRYENINNATTYGGDVQVNWQATPQAELNLAYAYIHTHNDSSDTELTFRPNHKVTAGLDYQLSDRLQLIQRLTYESKQLVNTAKQRYSPAWWTWDSKLNVKASPNLDVYAAINNLFDQQRDIRDANDQRPVDNRQWLIGANYHW